MSQEARDAMINRIVELELMQKELKRREYLKDLYRFNTDVLGVEKDGVLSPFHKEMCDTVMADGNRKLMLVPRGHLKSTLLTVGYSLLRIAQDPTVRILIANATYDMAVTFLSQIKKHLQGNQVFRDLYGDLATGASKWSENMITVPIESQSAKKEATVTAYGIGGNLVSQHYDVIIMDDIVNRDLINTPEQIQKTILFYKDALDLLEPLTGRLLIIGTRWHMNDLYGWIMDESNPEEIYKNFSIMVRQAYQGNMETGEDFVSLFPQKFTKEYLQQLKREKGPYEFCLPKETPILLSDWTEKPISLIEPGDEIIGFEHGSASSKSKLIKAEVKSVSTKHLPVQEMVMESGNVVRCTKEHKWYMGKIDVTHTLYRPAKKKSRLRYVYREHTLDDLTDRQKILWSYLGGMFDADGSAKSGGCLNITQGVENTCVIDKIRSVLTELGVPFTTKVRQASKSDKDIVTFHLRGGSETMLKLLHYGGCGKKGQILDILFSRATRFSRRRDKVVEIRQGDVEKVYSIETTSGNYIAWGYASKNSAQYMNDCVPVETAKFKPDWFKIVGEDELRVRDIINFTTVDPAIGTKKENDPSAIVTIGVDQYNNWFLRNIIRGKFLPSELIKLIFENWEVYHPRKIGVEMTAFQKSLQYALHDEMRRRGIFLPIVELKASRSKEERIEGLIPRYANGSIFHLQTCPFRSILEEELVWYPRGKHDDVADALAYQLQIAFSPRSRTTTFSSKRKNEEGWDDDVKKRRYLY